MTLSRENQNRLDRILDGMRFIAQDMADLSVSPEMTNTTAAVLTDARVTMQDRLRSFEALMAAQGYRRSFHPDRPGSTEAR